MAPEPQLAATWQRAIEANVRYYQALGEVTTQYLRSLAGLWGDWRLPVDLGAWRLSPTPAAATAPPAAAPPAAASPAAAPAAAVPALVLEAEAGAQARGVFLVSNRLARRVSAPVMTSAFRDPSGREVRPALRVEPDLVTLEPGGQMLLEVVADVDQELDLDVAYRGAVSIPGLSDEQVPVVLRRRAAPPLSLPSPPSPPASASPVSPPAAAPAAARPAPRRKTQASAAGRPAPRRKRGTRARASGRGQPRPAKT
ncbi:MAG: hypothetical protein JOZ15_09065 [Acidobacteria bacterium]|nr:hypothetical protein [Acidobacteriota bacterium]